MPVYTGLETVDLALLMPQGMRVSAPGGGIDGGKNGFGAGQTIGFSGGGRVVVEYSNCFIHRPEQHALVNKLDGVLEGGFRYIVVPILNDIIAPLHFANGVPVMTYPPTMFDPDGSLPDPALFGTEYATAVLAGPAALNAGQVNITVSARSAPLQESGWFSINHATNGHRAYRWWKKSGAGPTYTLAISPPIREATAGGAAVRTVRPLCTVGYGPEGGPGWDVKGYWQSRPSFQFVEAPRINPLP